MQHNLAKLAADTIRFLAADGVQKANSGHPGMPMGMADCAMILWTRFLRHNPADPKWPNRDRFVLSAGHGSMLLYSLLHLSGYDLTLEDLQQFRQWGSRTPGHPEYGETPGVETTTGPLGQGFSNGIGMAIAAKMTAARFNTPGQKILGTNRVYAIVSDGDLMEGVASEAASIAGHLGLGNIVYLYDDNRITIEGSTELAFSESVPDRFRAYGWQVLSIDGHDHEEIAAALQAGIDETERPTLIAARTHIGYGSPNKHDTSEVHGAPLGEEELTNSKRNLGWPEDRKFYVPEEVREFFSDRTKELEKIYNKWQADFQQWQRANPPLAKAYDTLVHKDLPDDLEEQLLAAAPTDAAATRALSGKIMQKIAELVPGFVGGSADLAPSNNTYLKAFSDITRGKFEGRNFHFGIREHAMGSIMNGMALYSGFIPFGGTFFIFSDYMRPAIRLAALMKLQVNYVFTHDSIFVGEDGPTHQPVEQMAAIRAIPNLTLFRPADGRETAMAWAYALRNTDGPTALALTRQKLKPLVWPGGFDPKSVWKGGYVLRTEAASSPELVLVGSGSEVQVALDAAQILHEAGHVVRVVSMPSLELFLQQDSSYRESVIPASAAGVVVVEAGVAQGWHAITRRPLLFIGMDRFGASAPNAVLAEKFGFTGSSVAEKTLKWLSE